MLGVHELAQQSGTPAHVVRYYLRIGLIQPASQQANGYRLFRPGDVERMRFIRMAKQLGFTLNEIKQITGHAELGESPCNDVRRIIQHRIAENRAKIEAMMELQTRMEQALVKWESMPDGVPDGHSVCHLIESASSGNDVAHCDTEE